MKCPLCETENRGDALECANCGKQLASEADVLDDVAPLPGLEQTLQDAVDVPTQVMADLETTQLASPGLQVDVVPTPGVEHTEIEQDPEAPLNWVAGQVAIDSGRELDREPRTPAPEDTGVCPWCNAPATGLVCDNCGRRRSRYSAPRGAEAQPAGDSVLCPACFARVAPGPRCGECGVPFPGVEL
ncbi:MAG TPA: hypothetical protein VLW85_15450 [Myxococcales bacterium]|nr:hypothetical protein [Myxococcales bacterium]